MHGLKSKVNVMSAALLYLSCQSLQASPNPKVFLELVCDGGIDPAMVFDWKGGVASYASEAGSALRTSNPGLQHVSNPTRPAVDAFFDQWGAKVAILNGIGHAPVSGVQSSAGILSMDTLSVSPASAGAVRRNWLAAYAFDVGKGRPVPVLAFPGINLSGYFEDELLVGRVPSRLLATSQPAPVLSVSVTDRIFRDMRKDFAAFGVGLKPGSMDQGDSRVIDRQFRFQQVMAASIPAAWAAAYSAADPDFVNQSRTALRMFASGKSLGAVVRVGGRFGFSSRSNHFSSQSIMLQTLFDGLSKIATDAYLLGIQTDLVVIVHGTSGRAPWLNSSGGKDPWPYGSMMFWGEGIKMAKVGAFDDYGRGVKIDPRFGSTSGQVVRITPQNAWASMLVLGGVNQKRWTAAPPVSGLIEGQ